MLKTDYKWTQPKTDWKITYAADGSYTGDYFEPEDYNRIKNNINFLRDYAQQMYDNNPDFSNLGEDVYYGSDNELKASWWSLMQDDLEHINDVSTKLPVGDRAAYTGNDAGYLVDELNRVESACLAIHTMLADMQKNKRRLTYRLGSRKGVLC